MGSSVDPQAVHADDLLLDTISWGLPADWLGEDPVSDVLVALRAEVDSAPIPEPRVPAPVGQAARHAAGPPRWEWLGSVARVLDPVLLRLPRSREDWRVWGSRLGDVLEDVTSLFLIVVACVIGLALVAAVMWMAPGWVRLLLLAGLATGWEVAVRLRRASRQVEEIERDELGEAPYAGWSR